MQSLGDKMRAARIEKGVTTSEAAKDTKMKIQQIIALEKEDFDKMVAPVYVKGFIRLYGKYLGLKPEELVEQYLAVTKPPTPAEFAADHNKKKSAHKQILKLKKPKEDLKTDDKSGNAGDGQKSSPPKEGGGNTAISFIVANWIRMLTVAGALLVLLLIISTLRNCGNQRAERAGKENARDIGMIENLPEPYLDTNLPIE